MFKQELIKAIYNLRMLFVILISLVLLFLSAYTQLLSSHLFIDKTAEDLTAEGLRYILETGSNKYHIWVESFSYMQVIFVFAIVLPYTASYVTEKNGGYHYLAIVRGGLNRYYRCKMYVSCISGGLSLFVPELLYYIGVSSLAQNTILESFTFYPVGLFSSLFFTNPDIYILLQMTLHFVLGASFGLFAMGLSMFFNKKILAYTVPFFVYLTYDLVISGMENIRRFAITNMYNFMSSTTYTIVDFILLNLSLVAVGILLVQYNKHRMITSG
ncbi:hypothetical protein [Paenibacillus sp. SYP-B4298]|uniref:hypothetical protein n=1 Tax=Paenibacillus sp. SYP-B4298 TaxID=2996034 RepID=UPI0022DDE403|nr:hypothetical protein [Paenibacillus sp. SYP-B4298]